MTQPTLTTHQLNRATLARQMLLPRADLTAPAATEHLAGLQAQRPISPHIALWTRLTGYQRDHLQQATHNRTIIKATLMRATLHLLTASDYLLLRTTLQPALHKAYQSIAKRRGPIDLETVLQTARQYLNEAPRTFAQISDFFTQQMPDADIGTIRYAIRTHLPLIQIPVHDGWGYPAKPQFTLAEQWLDTPIPTQPNLPELIRRYLAAYGPATITDMQTWSGLDKLKPHIEQLRPQLQTYRDERKRELFDLPGIPLPAIDTPAPVRFLPEFDSLLLAHKDRTRIIADEHRKKVFLPGLRVAATILIDGFVAGVWKLEEKKRTTTLLVEPFAPLSKPDRDLLTAEAEHLLGLVASDAKTTAIQIVP